MASADIKAMILKKQENKRSKLALKDIHRDLIVALTALPIYGKEVRDEEILTIIINGGVTSDYDSYIDQIKESFKMKVKNKEVTKKKDGYYYDSEGFMILAPRD